MEPKIRQKKTCAHRERDGAQAMPKEEKLAFCGTTAIYDHKTE